MNFTGQLLAIGDILINAKDKSEYEVVAFGNHTIQIKYLGITKGKLAEKKHTEQWLEPEDFKDYRLKK